MPEGGLNIRWPDPPLEQEMRLHRYAVKAAQAVYGRLETLLGTVTPAALLGVTGDDLRGAGLSWAKVRTVQAAAIAAETGQIDFAHLSGQPDETVMAELGLDLSAHTSKTLHDVPDPQVVTPLMFEHTLYERARAAIGDAA